MQQSEIKNEEKFIARLSQLRAAVTKLPDPLTCDQNTFTVKQDGNDIEFEKIIIKKNGEKTYRWSFKNRIFIDMRYIEKSEK